MNIYQRINAARSEVAGYIQKDGTVSTGRGGSYTVVTHDQVTAHCRAALIKHGVLITTAMARSHMTAPAVGADGAESKQLRYAATYEFTFVNCDEPDDRFAVEMEAHAMDSADKAPGKCLSYAKKMVILKLFELETGDEKESRSQTDEFDVSPYIEQIKGATTLEGLRAVYVDGYKAANAAGDGSAVKFLSAAKDARRDEIQGAQP